MVDSILRFLDDREAPLNQRTQGFGTASETAAIVLPQQPADQRLGPVDRVQQYDTLPAYAGKFSQASVQLRAVEVVADEDAHRVVHAGVAQGELGRVTKDRRRFGMFPVESRKFLRIVIEPEIPAPRRQEVGIVACPGADIQHHAVSLLQPWFQTAPYLL